jgi:PPM family protein phosphatase
MFWEQAIQYAALSDVGFRRQNNQDACAVHLSPDREHWLARGHLFIVADGMGGHAVGELASKMAVDTIPHTFDKLRQHPTLAALKTAIETANRTIYERGLLNRDFLRMGTTCTTLLLSPLGAVVGHVGDSRAYRVRRTQIDQLTRDHSLVWELVAQRKVHPRDAETLYPRNVITRSLGPESDVDVDLEGPSPVFPGDVFVVCSDGLCSLVNDSEIGMIARELAPADACRLLVNLANLRGGSDNITVVVIRVGDVPVGATVPEVAPPVVEPSVGTWATFVIICCLVAAGLVGLSLLLLTEHRLVSTLILSTVFVATIWLWWTRPRRVVTQEMEQESRSTIIWRPYRTASAKVTPDFVQRLAKLEAELHKAAAEEHWPVDLAARDQAAEAGQSALKQKRFAAAVAPYARAIDLLMTGLLSQRKTQRSSKWGKSSPAKSNPAAAGPPPAAAE